MAVDRAFVVALPKIELHAHLTGSISPASLREIWQRAESKLEDPIVALKPAGAHHDISTFFDIFDTYIYDLVNTPEGVELATRDVLRAFRDDGVKYLELRTTPRGHAATGMTQEGYLEAILAAVETFQGRDEMPTRLILSIDRRNTLGQALRVVDLALRYRARGVVGIDLCGNPVAVSIAHLAPAFARARDEGFKITLHFEVPASSTDGELEMLLAWRPDRIGHVIHTSPAVEAQIQRHGVGLELCLSCNVLAKMLPEGKGFAEHHFGRWKNRDNAIALSTDDIGVFGSTLSNEYHLAAQHFNLSRGDLADLSRRAIDSIFGGEDERARLRSLLDRFSQQQDLRTSCVASGP